MELLTLDQINAAADRLGPVIRRTPVIASRVLSDRTGEQVWLKCENLQRTGSFKPRGAYNRIANLSVEDRARGVVAASAGNHAQGVAWAATELGIASTVFMPVNVALPKLVATKAYGAQVHLIGETIDDALVTAGEFSQQHGAVLIHPFDHADIVAGQATVGLEILKQIPDVATILVPTGGRGLVAGIASAVHFLAPQVRVIGVQAANAAAWPGSLAAGQPVRAESMSTMADGIAVPLPGAFPFAHVRAFADSVRAVSEEALSRALLLCMERAKLIVEPAGAAAVAALMTSAPELGLHGPVCAVLSGGNIDPLVLIHVITHGLRAAGRYLAVKVTIPDRPGGLNRLLGVVSETGASVLDVVHSRTAGKLALDEVQVMLTVETRGPAHREEVLAALGGAGFVFSVEKISPTAAFGRGFGRPRCAAGGPATRNVTGPASSARSVRSWVSVRGRVCFGSGLEDRGGGGGGAVSGWGRPRALDSTVLNDAVATQDTITQLAECLLRRADRYRPREFGIDESDGTPDEKESRPKQQPPGYQACMMAQ